MATSKKEKQAWASRVTGLMEAAQVRPEDLAKRLKVNRSAVYHWRNGFRIPSRGIQTKLAEALGVSVAALNGWAA